MVHALFVTLATPQLSPVTGVPKLTFVAVQPALAETTTSAGQVMDGGCVSSTVTLNVQVLLFPLRSVAVLVTIVNPTGKSLPLGGTLTTLVTVQLSLALTVNITLLRPHRPKSANNTRLLEHVITGSSVSRIDTVNVQVLVFPLASVAVLVTVVVPTWNVLPLAGTLTRFVTRQLSVALTTNVTLLRLH